MALSHQVVDRMTCQQPGMNVERCKTRGGNGVVDESGVAEIMENVAGIFIWILSAMRIKI